ncbi:13096_t:CDS:1, partial [Funneliformis mosseae]
MSRDSTNNSHQTFTPSTLSTPRQFVDTSTILPNAKLQHIAAEKINSAAKSLAEYQRMIEITTDDSIKVLLSSKIIEEQKNISIQHAQLTKLKRHAEAQSRLAAKKQKLLEE